MFVVTFVRHGETKLNAVKIVQSRTHGELSDRGIQMAEYLGRHLRNEKFTRVYTSDLHRCYQTTQNILKHSEHPVPELIKDPVLRERDYGDLEFQPNKIIYEIAEQTGLCTHAIPIPGGETYEETKKRAAKFFQTLCRLSDSSSAKQENLLVVTHGAWIMCLMDHLGDIRENKHCEVEGYQEEILKVGPHNTATTRLVIHKNNKSDSEENEETKRRLEIIHIYDTTHLPDEYKRHQ